MTARRDVRKGDRHLSPQTNIRIADDIKKQMKHLAIDEGKTLNDLVTEGCTMLLKAKGRWK